VQSRDLGATLERVEPQDLIKDGLIPEFVGRLPVVGSCTSSMQRAGPDPLDLMYSLPNQKRLRECVITREIVEAHDTLLSLLEKAGEEPG